MTSYAHAMHIESVDLFGKTITMPPFFVILGPHSVLIEQLTSTAKLK